ncbi:MAG: 30S ribosomal protein S20 [Candidatus Zixiibacteriota bacterium]
MPYHKSNEKRMKTSERDRLKNRALRSQLRVAVKEVREEKNKDAAAAKLKEAASVLDRAAADGLIHWKNADRNKSRLAKFVQKLD